MRVLVCGPRDWTDETYIYDVLDCLVLPRIKLLKAQLMIGQKIYQELLMHGSLDLGEGLTESDVAPIILNQMNYYLTVEGIAYDVPKDFSVCGHLHGYLARGIC